MPLIGTCSPKDALRLSNSSDVNLGRDLSSLSDPPVFAGGIPIPVPVGDTI